ncbi:hypothetical protein TRVA0_018S00716 [Trichomonascus vanleenenianus]|uniref:uncharacterized protein n=1 Tax=Trichomonascus vanleenenianus TaxID=2268995 RepID=UPI003ECA6394
MKASGAIILTSVLSVACATDLSSMVDQLTKNTQLQALVSQYNTATGKDQSEIFQHILTVANSVVPGAGQLISEAGSEVTGEMVQDTAVATDDSSPTSLSTDAGKATQTEGIASAAVETAPIGSASAGDLSNGTDAATMSASQDNENAARQYTVPVVGAIIAGIGLLML